MTTAASEDALADAEARLNAAMLSSDVAALDQLIHDELVFTLPDGTEIGKREDLDAHRTGAVDIHSFDVVRSRRRMVGSTAVSRSVCDVAGVASGEAFAGTMRYVRTWSWDDGRWVVVDGSVSPVDPEAAR